MSRSKKLHVYGWQGWRTECPAAPNGGRQTREVCAAHSKAEAARVAGKKWAHQLFNFGETGNEQDIAAAMAQPGVVLWRPLDDRTGEWRT